MIYGFWPIFSIVLSDTLNPLSLYFDNGNVYIATAEGVIIVNNRKIVRINNPVISVCKSEVGIWALTPYKISIFNDEGKEILKFKFPKNVKSLRCAKKGAYAITEDEIVYISISSAPKTIIKGEFVDMIWSGDTLYLLNEYGIRFFHKGSVRDLFNINITAVKFEKFGKRFFVLDNENWLWVVGRKKSIRIINADNFTVKGDTLVLFRRENFGNFVYVLRVYGKI